MAVEAALVLSERLVFESGVLNNVVDIGMAFQAEGASGLDKRKGVVRTVGVVALFAIAPDGCAMRAEGFFRQHRLMAINAEPGDIGRQQLGMVGGMGCVASGTLPLLQQRVQVGPGQNFFKIFMACQAQLPPGAGFQF